MSNHPPSPPPKIVHSQMKMLTSPRQLTKVPEQSPEKSKMAFPHYVLGPYRFYQIGISIILSMKYDTQIRMSAPDLYINIFYFQKSVHGVLTPSPDMFCTLVKTLKILDEN